MTDSSQELAIVVIAGGQLAEREVSLRSGQRLATQLRSFGHQVEVVDLNQQLVPFLAAQKPDLVWPMIHGMEGESGSLQDLLQLLELPYVGTNPQGCRISQSKPVAKSVVAKNGLQTPDSITLPQMLFRQIGAQILLREVETRLGYPLMVKPAAGGSAMGINLVHDLEELRNAMVDAFAYGDEVLIERYVPGAEVTVSLVELQGELRALPLVEVETQQGTYDYDARYIAGRAEFFVPARLDEATTHAAKQLALDCHRVLELDDLSRIDLIVDQAGVPWFIDANTTPGMTDMSLWPQAADAADGYRELVNSLALNAYQRGVR